MAFRLLATGEWVLKYDIVGGTRSGVDLVVAVVLVLDYLYCELVDDLCIVVADVIGGATSTATFLGYDDGI
ncbi:hypothetical protein QVD17_07065 [Tagetes erecta]|uniref:Uncharacterized protein n=1 Tax=Tagetes erecta TaxID=13708 RepID=A0AAD8LN17_TARER|nr:hypothetical protein QVD17_07065 [Tagetes erecta]